MIADWSAFRDLGILDIPSIGARQPLWHDAETVAELDDVGPLY
ncbi:MAG: hypothetical protein OXC54_01690 [Rhodospirillaceae bacterium]|nr:hypothetical protein [Rhodospirillaceae bacterium]